jgi:hypothetical protein
MLNNNSFLRSRNFNFAMREIIKKKKNNNQQLSKSQRISAIINDVFRKDNFEDL